MDDQELIHGLKSGANSAYEHLYKTYYTVLRTYAFKFVQDRATAESVVNDVIYAIWKNRQHLAIEKTLRHYLIRAVRNRCINHFNQQQQQQSLRNQILLDYSFVNNESSMETIIRQELEDRLESALQKLPPLTETIFRKSRFDQLKYQEIADELHVSIDVVKYHIKSALSSLRISLRDYLLLYFLFNFF